jgi:hypothetical protein
MTEKVFAVSCVITYNRAIWKELKVFFIINAITVGDSQKYLKIKKKVVTFKW